ncbi:MAG TPA: hypothetical protein DDW92_02750 [Candidatus Veblenbacteria bacterium]|uniref:Uncharacterized protein n=3 Tax=Candidatus Vebleniibacteriota TaxID=1817921 RepID=A0A1G2QAC1_9BACT|nr:MAG: hypothetical protein UV52_C0025G0001 [Parcubacteria group bacterium GW2011_GWD1_42_9]OHA55697.1 MAG: hypothetical protein A2226_00665 [Candidatus Veblenbacteria bacterium RIFOXYA2_FULL_43_9]OHA57089.1 MAG: hypothetical protein A2588_00995 [Candidatus Veblenbacteria bacterium RIFOXYD1_FULL_43_11]OHA57538.1 MAG: hypothetical protein A2441_01230 [Candidatus Veblenbacteria bacterium RIFOXYC2_FULL_42_11]HAO81387.1 hypothetical protein [Candidatus Veblenbacteria bacterium]
MKSNVEVLRLIKSCGDNFVRLLQKLGILYVRPKRGLEPIGPAVGRQSTYTNPVNGEEPLHYVSENYYNGKVLLLYPLVIKHLAQAILTQMNKEYAIKEAEFQGLGPGGEMLAHILQLQMDKLLSNNSSINSDNGRDKVVLVQDILEPIPLGKAIEANRNKGKLASLICTIVNPDTYFTDFIHAPQGPIMLITLIKEVLVRYRQDHLLVKADVESGNIIWDPKNEWDKLAKVMEEADVESERERQRLVV